MNRNVIVVGATVLLVGGFGIGGWIYQTKQAEAVAAANKAAEAALAASESAAAARTDALERQGAQRLGDPDARVTIVEFFDPACETCAELSPYVKDLVTQNPGRVQVVSRYAPFHAGSDKVVAILEAARRQDLYWKTLEIMFSTQRTWADHQHPQPELLWDLLGQGGVDVARLQTDSADPSIAAAIAEDLRDAKALGVKATPEFFVNGKPLPKWGLRQLTELVMAEIKAKYG